MFADNLQSAAVFDATFKNLHAVFVDCVLCPHTYLTLETRIPIAPCGGPVITRQPPVSYAPRIDAYSPNMTVTERFTTFRYDVSWLSIILKHEDG